MLLQPPGPLFLLQGLGIMQQLAWGFRSGAHHDPLLFLLLHCLCFLTLRVCKGLYGGGYLLPGATSGCLVLFLLPPATDQVVKVRPELLLQ